LWATPSKARRRAIRTTSKNLREGLNDEPCDELGDETEQVAQPCTGEFSGDDSGIQGEFGAATV